MKDQNVKEYYEKEANSYNKEFYVDKGKYSTLRYRHDYILDMVSDLDLKNDAKILDVGCGPGEMIRDLMKFDRELFGIDIAAEMVNIAIAKTKSAGTKPDAVHIAVGDIEKLDFENNYFDLIICSGIIEYLKDDKGWLSEINRTLKKDGYLIINITNKYAVRRWTSSIIERIKSNHIIFKMMNNLKEKVLKKGKLHYFPFKPRTHSPKGFDQFMHQKGFQKIRHNYFDFAFLPAPIDTLFSFMTTPLRKYMEKFSQRNMVLNGTGYIVLFKKTS
jgi:ubiquinone/menaquinone biosynthesis C-methylase UbiE